MRRGIIALLAAVGLLLIVLPLVGLIWRVIQDQAWLRSDSHAVTESIWLSLLTSGIALLIIIVIGMPLAYGLVRWRFRGRRLLNVLIEIPIVLPPAVAGLALLVTFGRRGVVGGWLDDIGISLAFSTAAVIMAQVFVALPFFTRSAQVGFGSIDPDLEDAARVDGATERQVFLRITMPLALRALISGASLSWARALGEFGATIIFAGNLAGETRTMPLLVYNILESDLNAALWTALILVMFAVSAISITRLIGRHDEPLA